MFAPWPTPSFLLPMTNEAWPADKVERRLVADLVPYARNARTHSEDQVKALAASIKEWGWTTPVLLDEAGGIIAGHGRVLAAKKLKLVDVPCMTAVGWTEAQRKAYVIADNKLALGSDWDETILKTEFGDLKALEFDLALTGFSEGELGQLLEMPAEQDVSAQLQDIKFQVIVTCDDEDHQAEILERLEAEGLKCRPLML